MSTTTGDVHGLDTVSVGGTVVLEADPGTTVPRSNSPRPFLHPVRTLTGVPVTDAGPLDHPHHLGVGLPLPDVDSTTYWGGRTFVREGGSTLLDNHGTQRASGVRVVDGVRHEDVGWFSTRGRRHLREHRSAAVRPAATGWVLQWRSVLVPDHALSIGSPATNGRPGAFYGGWFWRTPFASAEVTVEDGSGVEAAHGSSSPWLLVAAPGVHLLAVQRSLPRPWFVRTEGYVGFGPALAHDRRLELPAGQEFRIAVDVLVADGQAPRGRELTDLVAAMPS